MNLDVKILVTYVLKLNTYIWSILTMVNKRFFCQSSQLLCQNICINLIYYVLHSKSMQYFLHPTKLDFDHRARKFNFLKRWGLHQICFPGTVDEQKTESGSIYNQEGSCALLHRVRGKEVHVWLFVLLFVRPTLRVSVS